MEIQYYGANCIRLTTKSAALTIDDNLVDLGAKSPMKAGDIAVFTAAHGDPGAETKVTIDRPGEYEVSGVSIQGVAARSHLDEEGKKNATVYKVTADEVRVLIVGHIYPELSEEQLEQIGLIDVMILPVGGNGYTLDGIGALKVVKEVEPKIIIPTHYEDKDMKYPVPQQPLAGAVQQLGMEVKETVSKLKLKSSDLPEGMQLMVLEK